MRKLRFEIRSFHTYEFFDYQCDDRKQWGKSVLQRNLMQGIARVW